MFNITKIFKIFFIFTILSFQIILASDSITVERNNNLIVIKKDDIKKESENKINTYIKENLNNCFQLKKGFENMENTCSGFSKIWFTNTFHFNAHNYTGWNSHTFGTVVGFKFNSDSCELQSLYLNFKDPNFSKENELYNLKIEKDTFKTLKYLFDNIYALGTISKKGDIMDLTTDFYWGTPITENIYKYK